MGSKPNERSKKEFSALPLGLFVLCLAATILEVRASFECPPQNNCEQCEANGTCTTCSPGYGFQPSTGYCEACGADCLECSPIGGHCTQCKSGFGPDFSSGNASCGRCATANCDSGCSELGAGKCDRCNYGYGPNPTFTQCTHCIANCRVCVTNTSYCDSCEFGYSVYDPGNRTCGECSPNCAFGCSITGAYKCDRCDPGYGQTANGSCGRGPTTNSFNSTAQPSQNQRYISDWTPDAATWITLVETTSSKGIIGGNMTCPVLEIGLGIGVPCGFIILVLVIIVIVLCTKNRKYKREIQDQQRSQKKMQSHTLASSETVQPSSLQYQQLQKQNLDTEYQGTDQYDSISTAGTNNTGYYATPLN